MIEDHQQKCYVLQVVLVHQQELLERSDKIYRFVYLISFGVLMA